MSLLARWLMSRHHVARAVTRAEREAIYRFRYEVYIEELKYHYPSADHQRRWLPHEEDEQPYTTLLYTGSVEKVTGAVQLRAWEPGRVPRRDFEALSLALFPGIDRLRVAQIGRLMIRRSLRGQLLLPSLLRAGYEFLAGEALTDLAFVDCSPGLVRYYRRLGALPYGGRLLVGPGVPLLLVPSDYARLRRLGSPVAPLVKRYFGPGKRAPLDLAPYRELLDGEAVPVEFAPDKVWSAFESRLLQVDPPPTFVHGVSPRALRRLAASAFLLKLRAGDVVTGEGIEERELFLILDGTFEVLRRERPLARLGRGELFGDIAFFTRAGERSATVRAATDGTLLVLRRKFLQELNRREPEAGFQILTNMGRILAERMDGMVRTLADGTS